MTPEEYIASGNIELVLLGAASPEEVAEMEHMAREYPEVAAEVVSVQATLDGYADLHAVTPPPSLKQKVLAAALGSEEAVEEEKELAPEKETDSSEAKIIDLRRRVTGLRRVSAAAIALLCAVSLGLFVLFNQLQRTEDLANARGNELSSIKTKLDSLDQELESGNATLGNVQQVLALVTSPGTEQIRLNPLDPNSNSVAVAYWNAAEQQVYVDASNLDADSDRTYVLWQIAANQPAPINIGAYDLAAGPMDRKVVSLDESSATAFAISLESNPATEAPTDIRLLGALQ